MSIADNVLIQALGLPESERAALAHQLLLSLDSGDFDTSSDQAWAIEIESRLDAVAEGRYVAHDWRETLLEIQSKLAQGRMP
jgi:putative addiction module component (TIGR02574 family)